MDKNEETKKQIILLVVLAVILGVIAIVSNIFDKSENAYSSINNIQSNNADVNNISEGKEELTINGLTESQLKNMKGLMDQDTYEIYSEYFENKGNKSIEQIRNEKLTQTENKVNDNGVDHISTEEQMDLEKDLQEALQKYGYPVDNNN